MRIAVIGAGLPGITTACFLVRAGYEVLVVERQPSCVIPVCIVSDVTI